MGRARFTDAATLHWRNAVVGRCDGDFAAVGRDFKPTDAGEKTTLNGSSENGQEVEDLPGRPRHEPAMDLGRAGVVVVAGVLLGITGAKLCVIHVAQ